MQSAKQLVNASGLIFFFLFYFYLIMVVVPKQYTDIIGVDRLAAQHMDDRQGYYSCAWCMSLSCNYVAH